MATEIQGAKIVTEEIENSSGANPYSITLGTENTTTGGTSIDFVGIVSGTQHIIVMFNGLSGSGTSMILLQLGHGSTTFETSGYLAVGQQLTTGANFGTSSTAGFLVRDNDASESMRGHFFLTLEDSSANTWICSHSMMTSTTASQIYLGSGSKSLSAPLSAVRLTRVNGSDTWDANGGINIQFT